MKKTKVKTPADEPKNKGGRPSKYKPEYGPKLIKHMSKGLSFETFAAEIGVNQDTLHEWVKVHEEFSEAKKAAYAQSQLFWEKMGILGMSGKVKGFNVSAWIFNMKNRFKWRDIHTAQEGQAEKEYEKVLANALKSLDTEPKK